jgi:hypothetical protein
LRLDEHNWGKGLFGEFGLEGRCKISTHSKVDSRKSKVEEFQVEDS